jgi:hypothetical protein
LLPGLREVAMIHIKVQYDAFTRTFRLIDSQFTTLLEGDALYDLNIPVMVEEAEVEEFIPYGSLSVAHA